MKMQKPVVLRRVVGHPGAPGGTVVLLGRLGFQKWFFEVGGVVVPKVYDLLFWIVRNHSRLEDL